MQVISNWSKSRARSYLIKYLTSLGYENPIVVSVNNFGHALITTNQKAFYLIYKKEYLQAFNTLFEEYIQTQYAISGLGESINREYLQYCIDNDTTLLFCYSFRPNKIYKLNRKMLLNLIKHHNNIIIENIDKKFSVELLKIYCEINGLYRTQWKYNTRKLSNYSGRKIKIQEKTYSFPIKILKNIGAEYV